AGHEELNDSTRFSAMVESPIELRFRLRCFGQQTLRTQQVNECDSAQSASKPPEEFPAIYQPAVIGGKGDRPLLRTTNGLHGYSRKANSLGLKSARQKMAKPCWPMRFSAAWTSSASGGRSNANSKARRTWAFRSEARSRSSRAANSLACCIMNSLFR